MKVSDNRFEVLEELVHWLCELTFIGRLGEARRGNRVFVSIVPRESESDPTIGDLWVHVEPLAPPIDMPEEAVAALRELVDEDADSPLEHRKEHALRMRTALERRTSPGDAQGITFRLSPGTAETATTNDHGWAVFENVDLDQEYRLEIVPQLVVDPPRWSEPVKFAALVEFAGKAESTTSHQPMKRLETTTDFGRIYFFNYRNLVHQTIVSITLEPSASLPETQTDFPLDVAVRGTSLESRQPTSIERQVLLHRARDQKSFEGKFPLEVDPRIEFTISCRQHLIDQ